MATVSSFATSGFLDPDQLAARTSRAVDAAVAAGRDLGLRVTDPAVLYDVFSVVVHLAPAPVVARIPTVLPASAEPDAELDAVAARQRRELDVVRWLAGRGVPVVPPSPLVPAEPVRRDGFSMTFWQFVERDAGAELDLARNAGLVVDLHAALRDYPGYPGHPGELPFLGAADPDATGEALAALAARPDLIDRADLDRARREWAEVLEPLVRSRSAFEAAFPGVELQPIHGDAPAVNVIDTVDGPLYADFELVSLGPVEWDVAALGPEAEAAYDAAARRRGARELDARVLRFVNAVGMTRAIATLALAPRLPLLVEALRPAVEQWRATPFAGGLGEPSG